MIKTAVPNTPVPGGNHAYTFDDIGNRKSATTNGRVSTYTPNALNQIDNRTIPRAFDVIGRANTTAAITVDGNAATRLDEYFYKELAAGSGAVHVPYSISATDANGTTTREGGRFLPATPETFLHDDDGNLVSDGRFVCTWDAENRLVAMETHSTVPLAARRKLAFSYDSMGRRISKAVWHGTSPGGWQLHHKFDFIHEVGGWNILAERSGGSKDSFLRSYIWGTDLSGNFSGAGGVGGLLFTIFHTSGKTFANGYDLNGNVTLLVNTATGQSAATYDYGPFGELLRHSGEYAMLNPFRFSTKYTDDETGLLDYGLRYYDSAVGRWRSRDPISEEGGVNLYEFVENNGINKFDLIGLTSAVQHWYSYIYGGHGLKEANSSKLEQLMTAAQNAGGSNDRVSAVSCFNGNINSRFPRSVKSSWDQTDAPLISDYKFVANGRDGETEVNPKEPGWLWIIEPAGSITPGNQEAYAVMEQKIKDVEKQAVTDAEASDAPCTVKIEVLCPSYADFGSNVINFNDVTRPNGKKDLPCGYKNTYKSQNKKWTNKKFNE